MLITAGGGRFWVNDVGIEIIMFFMIQLANCLIIKGSILMLDEESKKKIFTDARSHNGWVDTVIDESKIIELYELLKFGPTSANCCPARFLFIKSDDAKGRLKDSLSPGNYKCLDAGYIAVIAFDTEFHHHLPFLFPHEDAKSWFDGNDIKIDSTARLNASLQASYLMIAARAVGLDCGPMTGFNNTKLDEEFFQKDNYKSFMLCALGIGNSEKIFDRSPRFEFDEVCSIL